MLAPHDEFAGIGVDRGATETGRPGDTVEDAEQTEIVVFGERERRLPCRGADLPQRLPWVCGERGSARGVLEAVGAGGPIAGVEPFTERRQHG